ncbi:GNAT family N-acetyltransferase [Pseudomonas sp. XS1P51]
MDNENVIFIDKLGREIEIISDDDWPFTIFAKHSGREVGSLVFTDYNDANLLEHANVLSAYQKAGIGTRMFKEAILTDPALLYPNRAWSSSTGHQYYLSTEGAALINACLREKLLTTSNEADF